MRDWIIWFVLSWIWTADFLDQVKMKKTARPPDTLVEGANIKFTWRLQVFRPFILKVFHACNYTNSPSTYFTHFIIFTIFWQIMSCKHIRCFLVIHWHYFAIKLRLLSVCEKKILSVCVLSNFFRTFDFWTSLLGQKAWTGASSLEQIKMTEKSLQRQTLTTWPKIYTD